MTFDLATWARFWCEAFTSTSEAPNRSGRGAILEWFLTAQILLVAVEPSARRWPPGAANAGELHLFGDPLRHAGQTGGATERM